MELDLFEDFAILKGIRMVWTYWKLKGYDRLLMVTIEPY